MSTSFTNASGSTSDGRKRPGMIDDGSACSLVKRAKCNYHYVLASESSYSDEGTESVHSVQAKETDYCKDTTDTDTKSEEMVEYELGSSSDSAWQLRAAVSSSGEDVLVTPRAVAISKVNDSNLDIWPTGDEDDDDETESVNSLSAVQLFGCQICRMCKIQETENCFNLCAACYQIRKTAFPPRPRWKRKEKPPMNMVAIAKNHIQPSAIVNDKLNTSFTMATSQDSGVSCSDSSLPQEPVSSNCYRAAHPTMAAWARAASEMCIMCSAQPKNGIFVHTTGGHMCCCYSCAVKYWSKSKRCAWCNLKARNVIKGFMG